MFISSEERDGIPTCCEARFEEEYLRCEFSIKPFVPPSAPEDFCRIYDDLWSKTMIVSQVESKEGYPRLQGYTKKQV